MTALAPEQIEAVGRLLDDGLSHRAIASTTGLSRQLLAARWPDTATRTNTPGKVLRRVDQTGTCWIWTGCTNRAGYGVVTYEHKRWLVHRLIYTLHVGPIPNGLTLDHLCRNPACCRPDHLEPVSLWTNTMRGAHSLDFNGLCQKNLHDITQPGALRVWRGKRRCAECRRASARAAYHNRKANA